KFLRAFMTFEEIDRPERNRHKIKNDLDYDQALESALARTLETGRAIKVTLAMFHSSPAKGRLWLKGFHVRHRVLPDREHVAAWIEQTPPEIEEIIEEIIDEALEQIKLNI